MGERMSEGRKGREAGWENNQTGMEWIEVESGGREGRGRSKLRRMQVWSDC